MMISYQLLFAIVFVTSIEHILVRSASGNDKFTCVKEFTISKLQQWDGNVKYRISKELISPFSSWILEIHFDQPVTKLQQWFGTLDDALRIVHENGAVFFIKAGRSAQDLLSVNSYEIDLIASYDGVLEPKLKQAVLCGYTTASVVYPTSQPTLEPLPSVPAAKTVPKCIESTLDQWNGGVKRELHIPITKTTSTWMLELKFDAPWRRLQQWSCAEAYSDESAYICHENKHNGRQENGTAFDFQYMMDLSKSTVPNLVAAWFNEYHCKN